MSLNIVLSAFSLAATVVYFSVGIHTWMKDRSSRIHVIFLFLCLSYAVWSFAYSFAYLAQTRATFYVWNKIAAIGWCSFSAISLHMSLILTNARLSRRNALLALLYFPAAVFLVLAVFFFGDGVQTPPALSSFFDIGNFLYNFTYLALSMLAVLMWGLRSRSRRIRAQMRVLLAACSIPFVLDLLLQTILPRLLHISMPLMGQIYALIFIFGIYIAISRYQFLSIPDKIIMNEVSKQIMDMVVVLNAEFQLIRVSSHTYSLMQYNQSELIGQSVNKMFDGLDLPAAVSTRHETSRFNDVSLLRKGQPPVPVNIAYIPMYDERFDEFLGSILVIQDISMLYELRQINKELEARSIRDSLTNLYNHQHSISLLAQQTAKSSASGEGLALLMLDIDYFKHVNDTHGHMYGDYVIRAISETLVSIVGSNGAAGRFGGEEFIIMLTGDAASHAPEIAEEIRRTVADKPFAQDVHVTVSIGVKAYAGESPEELLAASDNLLYRAKGNGRNRVECDCLQN